MANQATAKKGEEVVEGQVLVNKDNVVDFSEYRNKRKAESIVQMGKTLDSISQELTVDPEKQKKVRDVIEKNIVLGEELMTGEENIRAVAEAAYGNEEITPEIEMAARKATEAAKGIVLKDPLGTRLYREQKIEDELATISDNLSDREKELLKKGSIGDTTSEKEQELLKKGLLNRQRKLAQEVFSAARMEDQEQKIMDTFRDKSPGKVEMAFRQVEMVAGLRNMSKERREGVLKENKRINSELSRFEKSIPSNEISKKVLALGGVTAHLDRSERSRRFLNSFQGRSGGFFVRFKVIFYRLSHGQIGGGDIGFSNGFVSQIGGQPTSDFVNNSTGLLLGPGINIDSGLGQIFARMAGQGVNTALGAATKGAAAKLAGGALSGPLGWAATAASFLKKFFGGAGTKLGIGARNGLAKGADGIGGGLMKIAFGAGALLASIGGLGIGTAAASTMIGATAGIAGYYAYQQTLLPDETVSALVSINKCEDGLEVNSEKGTPICDVSDKTLATNQCDEEWGDVIIGRPRNGRTMCLNGCSIAATSIILRCHDEINTPKCLVDESLGCKSSFFGINGYGESRKNILATLKMNLGSGALYNSKTFFGCNKKSVADLICKGYIVIVIFTGNKSATSGTDWGHYVVATAVLDNGDIALKDPSFSDKEFNYWSDFVSVRNAHSSRCLAVEADKI